MIASLADDPRPLPALSPTAPPRPPAWPGAPDRFQLAAEVPPPGGWGILSLAPAAGARHAPAASHSHASSTAGDAPAGPREAKARAEQLQQADALKAEEIYAAMRAEREASQARIRALLADAQTQWLQILEEVMLARQKVVDDAVDKWCRLLVG